MHVSTTNTQYLPSQTAKLSLSQEKPDQIVTTSERQNQKFVDFMLGKSEDIPDFSENDDPFFSAEMLVAVLANLACTQISDSKGGED